MILASDGAMTSILSFLLPNLMHEHLGLTEFVFCILQKVMHGCCMKAGELHFGIIDAVQTEIFV